MNAHELFQNISQFRYVGDEGIGLGKDSIVRLINAGLNSPTAVCHVEVINNTKKGEGFYNQGNTLQVRARDLVVVSLAQATKLISNVVKVDTEFDAETDFGYKLGLDIEDRKTVVLSPFLANMLQKSGITHLTVCVDNRGFSIICSPTGDLEVKNGQVNSEKFVHSLLSLAGVNEIKGKYRIHLILRGIENIPGLGEGIRLLFTTIELKETKLDPSKKKKVEKVVSKEVEEVVQAMDDNPQLREFLHRNGLNIG
jgi:hypothetical protein